MGLLATRAQLCRDLFACPRNHCALTGQSSALTRASTIQYSPVVATDLPFWSTLTNDD
jgi:hypothetical protein